MHDPPDCAALSDTRAGHEPLLIHFKESFACQQAHLYIMRLCLRGNLKEFLSLFDIDEDGTVC